VLFAGRACPGDDLAGPLQSIDQPSAAVPPPAVAPAAAVGGLLSRLGDRPLESLLPSLMMFGVVSLAPAVLLMTTSFVRMSVVLSLLRQGLGTQQLPGINVEVNLEASGGACA
jgi:flagellar biosynthetic protein FliP